MKEMDGQQMRKGCQSEGESVCRTWGIHNILRWKQSLKQE